jgi:hypothetical protein
LVSGAWEAVVVVFAADDLGAWLVSLLADAGRRRLTTWALGTEQERALRQAATAAVGLTAAGLAPGGGEQAEHAAMVISEVFGEPAVEGKVAGQATLLEELQAGVAGQLAVLDDAELTGTGQSSASLLGTSAAALAAALFGYLVREIMVRGSRGGPLEPLAGQLNHDVTHLQGDRLEGAVVGLAAEVRAALAQGSGGGAVAVRPVRLRPRPAFLAGREGLLADLDARLAGADTGGVRMVALCGLGGTGKTSVALEYGYRHQADLGLVWQFPAGEPTELTTGFGVLAAELGAADRPGGDPVAQVHGLLADRPGGWLLIFDNAPDAAALADVLPPAGDGQVIITTRSPHWPGDQAVEVPVLDTGAAAGFLLTRTGDRDQAAAEDLAGELGGLPLALEQAAAYANAAGRDLAGYLALYRDRRAELLDRGRPAGYDKRVTTTWSLSFAGLRQDAPLAAGLLSLLACCAPDTIPYRLLLQAATPPGSLPPEAETLLEDALAVDDAVAALRRYSLISSPVGGVVSVHRLVQAITLAQLPAGQAEGWQRAAAALITAVLPGDSQQPATWPVFAALLPHVLAALPLASEPPSRAAAYLWRSGNYTAARDLQLQILTARKRDLGPEHPETLTDRANLAYITGEAGDAAGARDQCAALLPVSERVLGAEHPETLAARGNFARLFCV